MIYIYVYIYIFLLFLITYFYKQVDGVVIGYSLDPILANVFLYDFEKEYLDKRVRSLVVSDLRSETKGSRFESGC